MSTLALVFLKWLEPAVTFLPGVYAMVQPRAFFVQLLPPAAQRELPTGAGMYALEYSVQLYALVLMLLAVVEHLIFRVKAEPQSKRALLVGMLLADVLHLSVVGWTWFCGPYAVPFSDLHALDTMHFVSLAGNFVLVWIALAVRVQYLSKAKLP
jgi:hypothetical protein